MQNARIRIIGQDFTQTEPVRACLILAGYIVDVASDPRAAAQTPMPDLVILSVAHPEEVEHGFVTTLKAMADKTYLPVLLAASSEAEALAAQERDADDVLSLPLSQDTLLRRVRTLLHLKRLSQADSAQESEATGAAAQETAAYYQAIFEHSTSSLLLVSGRDGRIVRANACARALTQYEHETIADLPLARLSPEGAGNWVSLLLALTDAGEVTQPDRTLLTANGESIPVDVEGTLLPPKADGAEHAPLLIVTLHDQRPAQARRVAAQRAAETEIIATLRQEINNPLFVISSNTELLQTALLNQDSSVLTKLSRIAEATRRIAAATSRLSSSPTLSEEISSDHAKREE